MRANLGFWGFAGKGCVIGSGCVKMYCKITIRSTGSFMLTIPSLQAPKVHEMLEQGATLVTVNQRLAKYARDQYGRKQVETGRSAWETPDILSYNAWLERCLDESSMHAGLWDENEKEIPVLLRPLQERMLWEQVIEKDDPRRMLFRSSAAARTAEKAWRLCVEWRIPIDSDPLWSEVDPGAFALWAKEFENRCRSNHWMDRARLADAVCEAIVANRLPAPPAVIFSGFDDFPPQLRAIMDALVLNGVQTCTQAFPSRAGKAVRAVFADSATEIEAAAAWARTKMAAHPSHRIGIVVNGLSQNRDAVHRVFEEALHPSSMVSLKPLDAPSFNISMGKPLSSYPLVKSALLILEMVKDNPEMETLSALLLSPFINGAAEEISLRAVADRLLRKSKQPRMPVMQVFRRMKNRYDPAGKGGYICPVWCQSLGAFEEICLDMPEKQAPSAWCMTFSRLLEAFGWPGDKSLDSDEYQTHAAWQDALVRFAATEEVSSGLSFYQAESIIKRLLNETLFQPETGNSGLQIMGLLEAAGEEFDAVWMTGLTSEEWPPPPKPNPFIPVPLQRRFGLPRATAARELDFARSVTRRLLASADEVVVSCPGVSGDSPLFPSALIAHLPEVSSILSPAGGRAEGTNDLQVSDYRLFLSASGDLEDFTDTTAPPLEKGESVPGGTGVVKAQAACPFSAFVQYRLGARPLEFPVSGIDAADRGILVHKVLEMVWKSLENQKQLLSKKPDALSAVVSESAAKAVAAMAREQPQTFTGRFADLEKQRLEALVMQWLEQDAARSFFDVVATETRLSVEVGEIRLSAFADRIDRLANGKHVIIDYKTGDATARDWFAERIAEPQLPLYCLALADIPAGVFFARVKKGGMTYIGIADDETIASGVKAIADTGGLNERFGGMEDIVGHWRSGLEALAGELARGHAPVSPVSVHKSCRYCPLGMVCRINELLDMGLVAA